MSKTRKHKLALRAVVEVIIVSYLIFISPQLSSAITFDRLLSTVKKIIVVGVEIGLDEAGSRLLGPTAWKYCKKIVSPVMDVLKEEYPSLAFDKPGDKNAQKAAQDAVNFLSNDKYLQDMLWKNFNDLKEGQKEILEGINQMNDKLDLVSKDINEIKKLLNEQTLFAILTVPHTQRKIPLILFAGSKVFGKINSCYQS